MRFLKDLNTLAEGEALDALPEDAMSEIQKNIKAGAKDLDQDWPNALGLVHKAYSVSGVERPSVDMQNAWKQYETNLQIAVEYLAKYRGMDGDWRMSSAIFHEALERKFKFRVVELGSESSKSHDVEAKSLNDIVDAITNKTNNTHDVKVTKSKDKESPNAVTVSFSKWGIRKNYQVKISQLI
jgi:hypothetical protein